MAQVFGCKKRKSRMNLIVFPLELSLRKKLLKMDIGWGGFDNQKLKLKGKTHAV